MRNRKLFFSLMAMLLCIQGYAVTRLRCGKQVYKVTVDTTIASAIKMQLNGPKNLVGLYYPQSVIRFYKRHNFAAAWIKPQTNTGKTWEAMLMIDCVLQFGMSHDDYHPRELLYDKLHQMLDNPATVNTAEKAQFDIMLTDAMLALINHLHYGKLNPQFTDDKIDAGETPLHADYILNNALTQKDFMNTVVKVQPQIEAYQSLAEYMRLVKGQYIDDCYEVPEATVRTVAVNMERLRWANTASKEYLQVNIPARMAKFYTINAVYSFKATVGSMANPTPISSGFINGFEVDKYGSVFFKLSGHNKFDLKSTDLLLDSDFSNGYIGIVRANKLAGLLLKHASPGNKTSRADVNIISKPRKVVFKKPFPFIVTYLTCEIKDGALINHNDIYNLDKNLEKEVYNLKEPLTMRK